MHGGWIVSFLSFRVFVAKRRKDEMALTGYHTYVLAPNTRGQKELSFISRENDVV